MSPVSVCSRLARHHAPRLLGTASASSTLSIRSQIKRMQSSMTSFTFNDLQVEQTSSPAPKPDPDNLVFGHHFSDHMLEADWDSTNGWTKPRIVPMHDLKIHPGAKVLHYAIELFEGMKAYRGVDNRIRIFRPDMNMERMIRSAERAALPGHLGVAHGYKATLFVVLGPAGPYFPTGFKPVKLFADPAYVRAWPGGVGEYKMGSNYAPTILIAKKAQELGCQQVLWLYDTDEKLTEVGTMNIFLFWTNENGEKELITPPLHDGIILPGVVRQTLLDMCREWNEFKVTEHYPTMQQIRKAIKEDRVHEMFGSGTACIVCPVDGIMYKSGNKTEKLEIPTMKQNPSLMQRLFDSISDIQYGRVLRPEWQYNVT